jgi:Ran GTPase-activating protein (RanGAP) involved in mRNA processing and transport
VKGATMSSLGTSVSTSQIFSIKGKGLKCDGGDDIEPHLKELIENEAVREAVFSGNTFGTEACEKIGDILKTKNKLQVSEPNGSSSASNEVDVYISLVLIFCLVCGLLRYLHLPLNH